MGTMERIDFIAGDDLKFKKSLIKEAKKKGFEVKE